MTVALARLTHKEKAARVTAIAAGAYAVLQADEYIQCDATAGTVTPTLPDRAANRGLVFTFTKTDASANTVVITRAGADTIDGATTYVLTDQYQSVVLVAGTNGWYVASDGNAPGRSPVALAEVAGNVAWNVATTPSAKITLTATGWTLVPSGILPGRKYTLYVIQDATGGRDFVFPSTVQRCRGPNLAVNATTCYEFTGDPTGTFLILTSELEWRVKDVTGATYTVLRQDYQTTLRFTNAGATVAVTGIDVTGLEGFEFELWQFGAAQPTLTPVVGQPIYWDPGVTAGSATFSILPRFGIQRFFVVNGVGWGLR